MRLMFEIKYPKCANDKTSFPKFDHRSVRMLPDINKGVGFARMESREKCEQIIQIFNGTQLPGAKDPLLVKFADGGSKKKNAFKNQSDPNTRTWREVTEVC